MKKKLVLGKQTVALLTSGMGAVRGGGEKTVAECLATSGCTSQTPTCGDACKAESGDLLSALTRCAEIPATEYCFETA